MNDRKSVASAARKTACCEKLFRTGVAVRSAMVRIFSAFLGISQLWKLNGWLRLGSEGGSIISQETGGDLLVELSWGEALRCRPGVRETQSPLVRLRDLRAVGVRHNHRG